MSERPLILVSNDDGIASPGLAALAEAMYPLGEVLVVAPSSPFSGAGRSLMGSREITPRQWPRAGVTAYAVDGAPAMTVRLGVLALSPRRPALMVSGINYGENVGSDVTASGTVGAAIEAATMGVPSLAFSLESPPEYHDTPGPGLDFGPAAAFARRLAGGVLARGLPEGIDLLKVDMPASIGHSTPWRLTRISRQVYWQSIIEEGPDGRRRLVGYRPGFDPETIERDSDVYVVACERAISVSPMTVDLSAPLAGIDLQGLLGGVTSNE